MTPGKSLYAFLVLLAVSPTAFSDASETASAAAPAPAGGTAPAPMVVEPFSAASLMQLLLGLGLVIVLIFALAWFVRRAGGLGQSQGGLRVVASLPLSTRERVVLVQAGEHQLLLGVAPGRVNLLQQFDTPVIDPQATPPGAFADRLREAVSRSASS